MKDIILDIETLGHKPGCIVLAIGAVKFDFYTGDIGDKFFARISQADSIEKGFKCEGNTMNWWGEQDPELREYIFSGKKKLVDVLQDFHKFAKGHNVWGNGILFDNAIIRETYRKAGFKRTPWHYRNDKDVRTLLHIARILGVPRWEPSEEDKNLKEHQPLHDAIRQAKYVCHYFKHIIKLRRKA